MEGKPNVNLRTNFGTVGAAGQVFQTLMVDLDGDGIPESSGGRVPHTSDPRYGNFSTAWGQISHFNFRNWGLFLDIQIPIRNRANEADLATVTLRQRQFESTMKNQQHLIMVEVRNAYETITTRQKIMEAARLARQLAEEQLDGETKRFQAGLSTNFEVLRFQRDLAENQVSELRAEVDYELAVTALHRAMNTIVEEQDIVLAKEIN
jgi:outer membrane protein TolC